MNEVTAKMSTQDLLTVGRAMERNGITDMKEYARWAIKKQSREILAEGEQSLQSED